VKILTNDDEGVSERFTRFPEKRSEKAREAFKSKYEEGFTCIIPMSDFDNKPGE
jgi:hypothetical protein